MEEDRVQQGRASDAFADTGEHGQTDQAKIEQYASDPASLANNVKALQGAPGVLRLRVGDWRVLFTEAGEVIAIIRIASRSGAYE